MRATASILGEPPAKATPKLGMRDSRSVRSHFLLLLLLPILILFLILFLIVFLLMLLLPCVRRVSKEQEEDYD